MNALFFSLLMESNSFFQIECFVKRFFWYAHFDEQSLSLDYSSSSSIVPPLFLVASTSKKSRAAAARVKVVLCVCASQRALSFLSLFSLLLSSLLIF